MARRTFSFVSLLMEGLLLHVLDTVEGDTPASAATSLIVTAIMMLLAGIDFDSFILEENRIKVNYFQKMMQT